MVPPEIVAKLNECAKHNFIHSRDMWFWSLAGFTLLVGFGIVLEGFELWHEMKAIIRERCARFRYRILLSEKKLELYKVIAFIGWIFIAGGVVLEGYSEIRVNALDKDIEECNSAQMVKLQYEADDAATSAKTAHAEADAVKGIADEARADAKDALAKAQAAQSELAHAEADAAKAQAASSRALSTADKAESHLAEVVKRANELTEQLKRLTTPRSLISTPQVVASLEPYNGTQYLWAGVCSDIECTDLLKSIDAALQQAGWKRLPSVGTYPALLVLDKKDDPLGITLTIAAGIKISVEAPNHSELIAKQDVAHAPQHVRAAAILNLDLAANVYPPEKQDKTPATFVNVDEGISTTVRITVGRKAVP
jgi:hypothetical protein